MARVIQGITFSKSGLKKRQKKLKRKRLKGRNDAGYPKIKVRQNKPTRTVHAQTYWMENLGWTGTLTSWNSFIREEDAA